MSFRFQAFRRWRPGSAFLGTTLVVAGVFGLLGSALAAEAPPRARVRQDRSFPLSDGTTQRRWNVARCERWLASGGRTRVLATENRPLEKRCPNPSATDIVSRYSGFARCPSKIDVCCSMRGLVRNPPSNSRAQSTQIGSSALGA
jgi:hypothetical protein